MVEMDTLVLLDKRMSKPAENTLVIQEIGQENLRML